jgi:catechol 2,3-dioxygenase-like lactoylglutathione lyase family enzyme
MRVTEILETCLYADDLAAAERFYGEVLGLERYAASPGRHVFFRCGSRMFLVFRAAATRTPNAGVPAHGATGPGHVAFGVPAKDLDAWRSRLQEAGVPIELEKSWPGGGRSLYFRDPAGNSLELTTPAIWGLPEDRLLAGSPR